MNRAENYDLTTSNEELLELCKHQDQDALRLLFRRHERPIYNLLYRMLSNNEDAEEALAEVFVKVWRGAAKFKGESKFTTWLYRIASNTARDVLRSRKTRPETSLEDVLINETDMEWNSSARIINPAISVINSEDKAQILLAMKRLSDEDRLLINLYHIQERDYNEIAQITDITPSNLKVKLFRARQRLRKLCADQEKGDEDEMRKSAAESSGLW